MHIHRAGTRPTRRASGEYFKGEVWQDVIIEPTAPARTAALRVAFAPGARTAWHTHPLGQTLHVTDGVGRIQEDGGPVRALRPGDTVFIPPGVKHWHGAAPDTGMVHIAIHEADGGSVVTWLEQVSDADYVAAPAPHED